MFYTRLIELCSIHDISITALTGVINVSQGNVTKWKNGSIPNGDTLIKLANYFNCSVDYLLGLSDAISLSTHALDTITIDNLKNSIKSLENELNKVKSILNNV